jgi:hypothetical protein
MRGITFGGTIGGVIGLAVCTGFVVVGALNMKQVRGAVSAVLTGVVVAFGASAVLDALNAGAIWFLVVGALTTAGVVIRAFPVLIDARGHDVGEDRSRAPYDEVSKLWPNPTVWVPAPGIRSASSEVAEADREQWKSADGALRLELVVSRTGARELFAWLLAPRTPDDNFVRLRVVDDTGSYELVLLAAAALDHAMRVRLRHTGPLLGIEWIPPVLTLEDLEPGHATAITRAIRGTREIEIEEWRRVSRRSPWLQGTIERALRP